MKNPENRTDVNQIKPLLPPLDADRRALAERIHPGVAVRVEDYLEPAISILTPEFPQSVCFRESVGKYRRIYRQPGRDTGNFKETHSQKQILRSEAKISRYRPKSRINPAYLRR